MERYETIWAFKTKNFTTTFAATDDYDLDLSWDDDGSVRKGLESGKYVAFVARVRVMHNVTGAMLGEDYLGGCIYESVQQFRSQMDGYFPDMVSQACAGARKQIKSLQLVKVRNA